MVYVSLSPAESLYYPLYDVDHMSIQSNRESLVMFTRRAEHAEIAQGQRQKFRQVSSVEPQGHPGGFCSNRDGEKWLGWAVGWAHIN